MIVKGKTYSKDGTATDIQIDFNVSKHRPYLMKQVLFYERQTGERLTGKSLDWFMSTYAPSYRTEIVRAINKEGKKLGGVRSEIEWPDIKELLIGLNWYWYSDDKQNGV